MRKKTRTILIFTFCLLVLGYYAVSVYIEKRFAEIESILLTQLESSRDTMSTFAVAIDKGEVDDKAQGLLRECSVADRIQFDTLLDNLGKLDSQQLAETTDLFETCAYTFSQQNTLMIMRMSHLVDAYVGYARALQSITGDTYDVDGWTRLLEIETERNAILREQVDLQKSIIALLVQGEGVGSKRIVELMDRARDIARRAEVLGRESDAIRTQITESL